jgi:hypothetical protein
MSGTTCFLSRLMDQAISAKPIRSPVVHRRCSLRWVQPYFAGESTLGIVFVCGGILSLAFKGKDFWGRFAASGRVRSSRPTASSTVLGFAQ